MFSFLNLIFKWFWPTRQQQLTVAKILDNYNKELDRIFGVDASERSMIKSREDSHVDRSQFFSETGKLRLCFD